MGHGPEEAAVAEGHFVLRHQAVEAAVVGEDWAKMWVEQGEVRSSPAEVVEEQLEGYRVQLVRAEPRALGEAEVVEGAGSWQGEEEVRLKNS
jgi:hypothetical protein